MGSGTTLAGGLVQHDGSCSGDVERADAAGHGNAQQVVAGATNEIMQPRAFPSKDQNTVAGEIKPVVIGRASLVQTDDPNILTFQILERTNQIDDARDAEMCGGSCAGLHGDRAQGCRTSLREDNAVDAGAVGNTQQRAKILGVLDAIESEQETGGAALYRDKEILDGQYFLRTYDRYDALMRWCSGELCELLASFLPDSYAGLAARSDEAGKPLIVAFAGDQNMVKTAFAGFQGLLDRMEAVENFHESSLDCR